MRGSRRFFPLHSSRPAVRGGRILLKGINGDWIMKNNSQLIIGISSVALMALLSPSARATTTMFQASAQGEASLIHQYSFDGVSNADRRADQMGTIDLTEQAFGSGTTADLGYGLAGWDGTSQAFSSFRQIPGADSAGSAQLTAPGVTFGNTFSYEAIISPGQAGLGGGLAIGFVLATRVGSERGYFLVQGDGNLPSPTHPFSSTLGNGYNVANTNIITGALTAGDWYYVAGSYTRNGSANVTWTNYVANLTAGETVLNAAGPFTNTGVYPTGAQNVGIGGRWDNGESFPGLFDEVNLYSGALSEASFQANLDQLLIPEPTAPALLALALIPILGRRRCSAS